MSRLISWFIITYKLTVALKCMCQYSDHLEEMPNILFISVLLIYCRTRWTEKTVWPTWVGWWVGQKNIFAVSNFVVQVILLFQIFLFGTVLPRKIFRLIFFIVFGCQQSSRTKTCFICSSLNIWWDNNFMDPHNADTSSKHPHNNFG